MLVSRWCYQSGPLKVIGQKSLNGIGCKILVKFVIGSLVGFDPSIVSC